MQVIWRSSIRSTPARSTWSAGKAGLIKPRARTWTLDRRLTGRFRDGFCFSSNVASVLLPVPQTVHRKVLQNRIETDRGPRTRPRLIVAGARLLRSRAASTEYQTWQSSSSVECRWNEAAFPHGGIQSRQQACRSATARPRAKARSAGFGR